MNRRVVITGLGAVTPLGNNVADYWDGLKNGKNGIDFITKFDTTDYEVKIAAEVKDFEPEKVIEKKLLRRYDSFTIYSIYAADEALKDCGMDLEKEDMTRFGCFVGSGVGGMKVLEDQCFKLYKKGPSKVTPLFIPMSIANMAAGNISIHYGMKGPSCAMVSACSTGNHAIGEAFRNIKHGYADMFVAGGTEAAVCGSGIAGFTNLTALSTKNDPNRASIPFDKERDGFVMGEGAGIVILEELEHALARGAKIYCEIVGYGSTSDSYHMTAPSPTGEGGMAAMKLAMQEGNVKPEDVTYVNAHGTSTPLGDKAETITIKGALGECAKTVSVSSTKSMTGHLLGGAGAIEAIACIKAIENDFVPPTINLNVADEECDLDYTPNVGKAREMNAVLSNSLGFGGHNAVLCFKKFVE